MKWCDMHIPSVLCTLWRTFDDLHNFTPTFNNLFGYNVHCISKFVQSKWMVVSQVSLLAKLYKSRFFSAHFKCMEVFCIQTPHIQTYIYNDGDQKNPRKASVHDQSVIQEASSTKHVFELPPIPPGEDKTSFERHNRVLKFECSKSNPNMHTVQELMNITFSMQRRDILSQGHTFNPLTKYPYFRSPAM